MEIATVFRKKRVQKNTDFYVKNAAIDELSTDLMTYQRFKGVVQLAVFGRKNTAGF
jgi:hypothetical protein